jgi:hypothetical protein
LDAALAARGYKTGDAAAGRVPFSQNADGRVLFNKV